ncbi:MAG: hypothetical protein SOZ59_12520 [Candidatus Limivivens sp.]|nr:hypothetical protein [Candidatus Limivivens sp.]
MVMGETGRIVLYDKDIRETLKPQFCQELFERDYTLWDEERIEKYKEEV